MIEQVPTQRPSGISVVEVFVLNRGNPVENARVDVFGPKGNRQDRRLTDKRGRTILFVNEDPETRVRIAASRGNEEKDIVVLSKSADQIEKNIIDFNPLSPELKAKIAAATEGPFPIFSILAIGLISGLLIFTISK